MGLLFAYNLKVPLPDLSGNRLADRTKHTELLHLMLHMLVTCTLEQPQSSRCNVELGDVVLLNNVPVAGEVRVRWSALENNRSDTKKERSIDDIGMASNPANVTTAEEDILVVDVEDVLAGRRCTYQVAGGGMHDTLWLAR